MSVGKKLRELCAALAPGCREASRMQSERMEGPLPISKRIGLFLHLLMCKWCRRYGRQVKFMRTAARERPEKLLEAEPGSLSSGARERIKSRLAEENRRR